LLSKILINQEVSNILNNGPTISDTNSTNITNDQTATQIGGDSDINETKIQEAASAILKICGNSSILINQIVPSNFTKYWEILQPLIKPEYRNDDSVQQQLFNLAASRDSVGEAMWYIYTGLLLIMLVQLKITTRGCQSSVSTMQQNYQKYLDNEQAKQSQQAAVTDTVYTIT
jgi:hypothetical protein